MLMALFIEDGARSDELTEDTFMITKLETKLWRHTLSMRVVVARETPSNNVVGYFRGALCPSLLGDEIHGLHVAL